MQRISTVVRKRLGKPLLTRLIIGLNVVVYPLVLGYWWIARPSSTSVVVFLQHQNRVLLVRNSYGTRRWTAPGGSVRRGESPEDAARREVREEVGVEVGELVNHGSVVGTVSGRRDTTWIFSAPVGDTRVQTDSLEIAEARWFQPEQATAVGVLVPPDLERQHQHTDAELRA